MLDDIRRAERWLVLIALLVSVVALAIVVRRHSRLASLGER
jgi:hypothetical protein